MQYIEHKLDDQMIKEGYFNDGHIMSAPHIHEYLARMLYARRSQVNPLWNMVVVAGVRPDSGKAIDHVGCGNAWKDDSNMFLGFVDLYGVTYTDVSIATGFGAHLARPIMRRELDACGGPQNLTEEDARRIINDCMKVLYYRDARSLNKFSVATITHKAGVKIEKDQKVDAQWDVANYVTGYGRTYQY